MHTSNTIPAVKFHALGCIQVGPLRLIRLHLKKKALKTGKAYLGTEGLRPESEKIGPLSNLKGNATRHQRRGGWSVTQKLGKERVPGEVN